MSEKNFSLLRPFTGAEGELPCDSRGSALSPGDVRFFNSAGLAGKVKVLPLSWLDGKPVYPDSLICWDRGPPLTAEGWTGWDDPYCLDRFSWPAENLGSADKYVKKNNDTPPKTYNVVILIDGEVNYKTKALPGDVITTYIKSE